MSITHLPTDAGGLDAVVAENVNTLCHRARMSGRQLAEATGIHRASIARKMAGGTWTFAEVARIADYFAVTMEEIATALPTRDEWEGRWSVRHQGLEPRTRCLRVVARADGRSAGQPTINESLTVNRRPRHLVAVAS